MDKAIQDATLGTVGWFAFAAGTAGLTAGQTLRVNVVNLGAENAVVFCGLWSNPRPLSLAHDSYTLGAGEARNCDLKASDLPSERFSTRLGAPRFGPLCAATRAWFAALEVFDSETGRTSIILSLQEVVHRGQRFTRCVGPEEGDEPTKRPFPVHLPKFWSEPGPDSSQWQRIILVEPLVLNHDRSPERWNGCAIDVSVPCGIPGGSLHRWIEVGAIDGLDSKSRRRRNRRRILRHP
jgi:hypothetical protein